GSNGIDGAKGDAGINGVDGINGATGAKGDAGSNGIDGINGTTGAKGDTGINGVNGNDGATGVKGDTGINGSDGATGTTGAKGDTGSNGIDGINGTTGANGIDGAIGAKGNTGTDGADGLKGSTGSIGATGANGKTAYEIWLSEGNTGTQTEFITSLKGETGAVGPQGPSPSYSSTDDSVTISTSSTSDVLMSGMSKSPEPGTYLVFFNSEYSIAPAYETAIVTTDDAIADLEKIYTDIDNMGQGTYQAAAGDIGGKTIKPGIYSYGGALSIGTDVTLDAQNDPNAVFIFKTAGAFNTTAGITVKLVNGASAKNIFWVATGAIGLGANSIFFGSLLSRLAVAVGADCTIEGRMLTTAGALAFGPGTISVPLGTSQVSLGAVQSFVMLTKSGAIANTGISTYTGQIATNLGAITAFETAIHYGEIVPPGGNVEVIKEIPGNATFSLYNHGVLIPNSTRTRTTKVNTVDVTLQAMATIAQDEKIEARWSIDAGTLSVKNRILTIIKVN
ncbi:ice-binding family protein, partial [uncultured Flavobacterium sp.]|uniref:ice-binding family protein n=1 Tax=uncultured Flavobacterium sp. TaxID=165435 RepID=UPI0030EC7336